jgi:hypothetical protein
MKLPNIYNKSQPLTKEEFERVVKDVANDNTFSLKGLQSISGDDDSGMVKASTGR